MLISCIGHAMFLLEPENGPRIVIDPVDEGSGYVFEPVPADEVLVSHKHHDHCALEHVAGAYGVTDTVCKRKRLAEDVYVTAVHGWHDDVQGAARGETLLFLLEAEGLRVAHLGDLGVLPDTAQIEALAPVDVLLVPVGGKFTIDARQAKRVAELLQAKVILPMHYRTAANAGWPIAPVTDFTAQYAESDVLEVPLLRVTAGDLKQQRKVVVVKPAAVG